MLNRFLRQKLLVIPDNATLKWWTDQSIEKEGSIDQQSETEDLQPLERFPSQEEGDDPDEQCSAGIDGGSGSSAHSSRNWEAEEVESTERS